MNEAPIEMPTSWWERLRSDKRRMAFVVAAAAVALLALVAGVMRFALAEPPTTARTVPVGVLDPTSTVPPVWYPETEPGGEGGSATRSPAGQDDLGESAERPGTGGASGDAGTPDAAVPATQAGRIAYRIDGAVWVAQEDGSGSREIARAREGAYAISPDGTVLAVVASGELVLIGVEDGSRTVVGPAEPRALAWHPDSSAVVFLRAADGEYGVTEVFRVARAGGAARQVMRGDRPVVARDGTIVALPLDADTANSDPARGELLVAAPGGTPRRLVLSAPVGACGIAETGIVYAVSDPAHFDEQGRVLSEPLIRTVALNGTGDRRLFGPPDSPRLVGYDNLIISPDGKQLLYAEVGDDGYSRAWVAALDGGAPVPLTIRRDTYPVGWSADGTNVFFVEGNAFQGEVTALMRTRADGTGRRLLVEGAVR